MSGAAGAPATAELRPIAGGDPLKSFTLVPAVETGWVSAGSTHLDPGAYAAQFLLPPGATLSQIEVAPPCVNPIEPANGWQATGVTTSDDLAVTALKAIDVEHELPPDATPIELSGDAFQVEAPYTAVEERAKAAGLEAMTLQGRQRRGCARWCRSTCPRPASTACRRSSRPGAASASWWTAAARRSCARARAAPAGGRS